MNLGERIRRRREERFYSVAEMSGIIGCSVRAIYDAETGKHVPKLETMAKLSKVLDTTIDELVGDDYE